MPARLVLLFLAAGALASAQPAQFSTAVRGFIKVDAPVVVGFDPAKLIAAVSGKVGLW
jgi:hypothetical protein